MDWFKVSKKDLRYALSCVRDVVNRRGTVHPHERILLETRSGTLLVTGTNLKVAVRVQLADAEVLSETKQCVEYNQLSSAVSKLKKGTVDVRFDEGRYAVELKQGSMTRTIQAHGHKPYPDVHEWFPTGSSSVSIPAPELFSVLQLVAPAMCQDKTRYRLTAVFLEGDDSTLRAVTTDGHRLHVAERDCGNIESQIPQSGYLLPPHLAHALIGALKKRDGDVIVEHKDERLGLLLPDAHRPVEIASVLMDERFPDWRQVIPKDWAHEFTVDREWLTATASTVKQQFDRETGMVFEYADGCLHVLAESPDVGEFKVSEPASYTSKDDPIGKFGIRCEYVLDAVKHLPDDRVRIRVIDPLSPIVFGEGENRCFVMPVRL